MGVEVGNLVRWVISHKSYESNGDVLVGIEPIYKYGVVVKKSPISPTHIVVATCDDARWHVVDTRYDSVEVLSEGTKNG